MNDAKMNWIEFIQEFLSGWRFAVVALSILLFLCLFLLAIIAVPDQGTAISEFAKEFKVWCFGYNPATGTFLWAYFIMFFSGPVMMMAAIFFLWKEPLGELFQGRPRAAIPYVVFALFLVVGVGSFTAYTYEPPLARGNLPFPEKTLRTHFKSPDFTLINQDQQKITLSQYTNKKIVILTSVYSTCGATCPMIMNRLKEMLAFLTPEERKEVVLLSITMDPARDTPEVLKKLAKVRGMEPPFFHFLTGDVKYVNQLLDRYQVKRKRDPKTGIIDHVNLFMLVDRQGKLAYRFTLGKLQKPWFKKALKLLVKEAPLSN